MDEKEIYKRAKEIESTHGYKMGITKKMDKEDMINILSSRRIIFEEMQKAIEEIINADD